MKRVTAAPTKNIAIEFVLSMNKIDGEINGKKDQCRIYILIFLY